MIRATTSARKDKCYMSVVHGGWGYQEDRQVYYINTHTQYLDPPSTSDSGSTHNMVTYNTFRASSEGNRPSRNRRQLIPGTTTMWIPPSGYVRAWMTTNRVSGTWQFIYPGYMHQTVTGIPNEDDIYWSQRPLMWSVSAPGVIWSADLRDQAVAQATLKIKERKASLGESLAEAAKTYNMIVETSTTLLQALLAVKRGKIGTAWNLLKDGRSVVRRGADLYLQYQYGWRPIMSDIKGSWDLFKEQLQAALIITGSSKSEKENLSMGSTSDFERSAKGWRQAHCKLYGQLDDKYRRIADRVGLSNPLSLAWELVPFSFVLDWFIPVGNVLEAFQDPVGVKFLGGFTTIKGEFQVHSRQLKPSHPFWSEISPRYADTKGAGIWREAYSGSWPKAGFYTLNPFTQKHSHGESAIALLIQKLVS